jgi:hypothetical protein
MMEMAGHLSPHETKDERDLPNVVQCPEVCPMVVKKYQEGVERCAQVRFALETNVESRHSRGGKIKNNRLEKIANQGEIEAKGGITNLVMFRSAFGLALERFAPHRAKFQSECGVSMRALIRW